MSIIKYLIAAVFFSSCNGMFFYPGEGVLTTPEKFSLAFEENFLQTPQGVKLHYWVIEPRKKPAKGRILQFHGNAENLTSHFLFTIWLIEEGYQVMTFDYRGYGQSSGEATREGLIEDGIQILKKFCEKNNEKANILLGQSLGGAISIVSLAQSNNHCIDALVLESTFSSYRGVAQDVLGNNMITWSFQWLPYLLISGDYDPVDYISQIKIPILFAHQTHDKTVSYEEGQKLYQQFDGIKDFWTLEQEGHVGNFNEKNVEMRKKLVEYLARVKKK